MKKILFSLLWVLILGQPIYAQWDLNRCLTYATANNKELLGQKEQLTVSDYEKKIAGSKLLPDVNVTMESNYYWKIPVQSYPGELFGLPAERVSIATGAKLTGNYGVNINWNPIDVQSWQNIKLEKLKSQSAEYGVQSLQKLLLRNVKAAFFNVQIQKQHIDMSANLLEKHAHIHELLTRKFKEGLLDKITMNQSAGILTNYQAYQDEQQIIYQKSLLELKYWMGFPLDQPLDLRFDMGNAFVLNNIGFNAVKLPDYKEKEVTMRIAEHHLKASKYYMLPQLSLVSSFGMIGFGEQFSEFSNLSKWHSNGYVGFRLRMPIFVPDGINTVKRNRAIYKQTSLAFAAYQDRESNRFLQVKLEVQQSLTALSAQETLRKLAEENLMLCNQKIEQGIINMIQLQQVQQELIKTIEEENRSRLNYLKNQIELNYLQNEI